MTTYLAGQKILFATLDPIQRAFRGNGVLTIALHAPD